MEPMQESRVWWTPGAMAPAEATIPDCSEDDIHRWPLGVNGKVGDPSAELTLAAGVGDIRVAVSTATASWHPQPADRFMAAVRLISTLPLQHLPTTADLIAQVADDDRWTSTQLDIDEERHPALSFHLDHQSWVLVASRDQDVISVAVSSPGPIEVGARTVADWSGHGLDLSRPQPAAAFSARAKEVSAAWRGEDIGESEPR